MHGYSVFITGGNGQVGSYICEELVGGGHDVTILSRESSGYGPAGVKFVKGDILDAGLLKMLVKDVDIIIHCAAQNSPAFSIQNPLLDASINIAGTLNLLDAARDSSIRRFVYFSSSAVYGEPLRLPIDEGHPQNPLSPYGVSKLSGEKYALVFNRVYGLPATVIRPFNIYSPREDPSRSYSSLIAKFIGRVSSGKPPIIQGDGSIARDYVSVHDVADMVLLMMEKNAATGNVFNCGNGIGTRLDDLAMMIIGLYGHDQLKPRFEPEPPGQIRSSIADISLAKKILGYSPKIKLGEGLREIIDSKNGHQLNSPYNFV
jgi:UDP-glucose 4-epimerase